MKEQQTLRGAVPMDTRRSLSEGPVWWFVVLTGLLVLGTVVAMSLGAKPLTTVVITQDNDDPFPGTPFEASDFATEGSASVTVPNLDQVDWAGVNAIVVHRDVLKNGVPMDWLYQQYVGGTIIMGFDIDSKTFSDLLQREPVVVELEDSSPGSDVYPGKEIPLQIIHRRGSSTVGGQLFLYDLEQGYEDNVMRLIARALRDPRS